MAAPASGIVIVPPAGMRTFGPPMPFRVSITRLGVAPTNVSVLPIAPANQPVMSTRKSVAWLE